MSSCVHVVDVIRFQRPQRSDQSLFVSNLPSEVPSDELWASLHAAFSQFGLVHKVQPVPPHHPSPILCGHSLMTLGHLARCVYLTNMNCPHRLPFLTKENTSTGLSTSTLRILAALLSDVLTSS